jgi:hypothetical protein
MDGWIGLRNLNLGYVKKDFLTAKSAKEPLAKYVHTVWKLSGSTRVENDYFGAYKFQAPLNPEIVEQMVAAAVTLMDETAT